MGKRVEIKYGDVYGHLTIIKEIEPYVSPSGYKSRMVLCSCDCGTSEPFEVRLSSLRSGDTTSCGCYSKEKTKERNKEIHKKYNTYDLSGEYGIGYTSKGEEFYFDLEDYNLIKDYCWRIDANGYVVSRVENTNKTVSIHRLVMNAKEGKEIDHIFHKKNDNRKSQLREVTPSQNSMNRGVKNNNVSGVTGVCFDKKRQKWLAQIGINGKNIYLGSFEKLEDAINTRKEAEIKYFGEYMCKDNT